MAIRIMGKEDLEHLRISDLGSIVELHGNSIYGFCRKITQSREDAADLYQEAFLKAAEICHRIDENQNPKGFIISIAIKIYKNNCRKFAWRQRIAPTVVMDDVADELYEQADRGIEEIILSKERDEMVRQAVSKLDDKYRMVIYMYYTAEMSVEEIAKVLKIPKGTVKSRLHKARQKTKDSLGDQRDER